MIGCWKLPYEIGLRHGVHQNSRTPRLGLAARTGQPHIYGKPGSEVRLSVPVHGNQALKIGLLKHLMKSAELAEKDLSA